MTKRRICGFASTEMVSFALFIVDNLAETTPAVYNVSEFLDEHPGGEEILRSFAGKDATEGFEDAAHSEDAKLIMDGLIVGRLPHTVRRCVPC